MKLVLTFNYCILPTNLKIKTFLELKVYFKYHYIKDTLADRHWNPFIRLLAVLFYPILNFYRSTTYKLHTQDHKPVTVPVEGDSLN